MYSSNDFQTAYFVSTLLELLTGAEGSDQIKTDKKHNDLVLQCRNKIVSLSQFEFRDSIIPSKLHCSTEILLVILFPS